MKPNIVLDGEVGLLPTVERVGAETRDEVAEDDLSVGDASRWTEDAAGGQSEVRGKCKCRRSNSTKHVRQVEAMTEVMQKTGIKREQLKCVYPAELLRRVLGFLMEE